MPDESVAEGMRMIETKLRRAGPERMARTLLVATMLGVTYLDFFGYRAQGYAALGSLDDRLAGLAPAPEQYRMGIFWLAHAMVVRLHFAPTMALASIDGVCGLVAVLVLFGVLIRTSVYREANVTVRWFGAAAFVLLVQWFLAWLLWLQKPETLPAAACLAVMLWLWEAQPTRGWGWKAAALVAVAAFLATFRGDAACLLSLGVLLFVGLRREPLSLPRAGAAATALLCVLLAGGVQLWLMRVVFPQANYGRVKMWQLWPNVKHGTRWPPFLIFLLPVLWMAVQVVRRRFVRDAGSIAFLFGAGVFMVLWVTIGKIDEVRIFLPFAFALMPLTVEMAMVRVEGS